MSFIIDQCLSKRHRDITFHTTLIFCNKKLAGAAKETEGSLALPPKMEIRYPLFFGGETFELTFHARYEKIFLFLEDCWATGPLLLVPASVAVMVGTTVL